MGPSHFDMLPYIHNPMPNVDFKSGRKKDKQCFLHYGTITYDTITFFVSISG